MRRGSMALKAKHSNWLYKLSKNGQEVGTKGKILGHVGVLESMDRTSSRLPRSFKVEIYMYK